MRPIDADKLREDMNAVTSDTTCPLHIAAEVDQYIDCAPTITYEDLVPHGRWETECEPHYTCSACKHWFNLYGPTNFCPNCGAKMDGGNEK